MTITICKKIFASFFLTNCFVIFVVSFFGQSGVLSNEENLSIFIIISILFSYIICFWLARVSTSQIRKAERTIKNIVTNEEYFDSIKTNSGDEISSIYSSVNALLVKIKNNQKKQIIIENQKKKLTHFSAVAKTTQMLAHNVRQPISMVHDILRLLEYTNDPYEIVNLSKKHIGDVEQVLTCVNGMIEDVLEISRTVEPKKKSVSPESIIEDSLTEVCRICQKAIVKIHYELNHQHMINVDAPKLQRVFSNIFIYAIQAMKNRGTIWIKTQDDPVEKYTRFCIVNSGAFIPREDVPQLFNAFYAKDKSDGTGLGLAIVKKIVAAHGGQIWCESSEEKQLVEFHFSLPIAERIENKNRAKLARLIFNSEVVRW